MKNETGTIIVDFSSGFDSAPAFWVYFDFALEVYFGFALRVGIGEDGVANILSSCCLNLFSQPSTFLNLVKNFISSMLRLAVLY